MYVHFPYCLAKCPYCDFVSYSSSRETIDGKGYADAVLLELAGRAGGATGRIVSSVFFGGGTPSLWEPRELGRVVHAVRSTLDVIDEGGASRTASSSPAATLEVTVECNPSSLDDRQASSLANVGVNRLSIGVQSLREDRLRYLGRLHDGDGARRAVRAAMNSGAARVSADFIFGLPGQTPDDARREVLELVELGLTHLSCYQLTIEPGTRFGELARRGRLPLADEGAVAESYAAVQDALEANGLRHYEVSNYALPGDECRHNLGYWHGDEYLGLGCAAVGFLLRQEPNEPGCRRSGVRWRNHASPRAYVEQTQANETEELDAETLMRERIMLGLRLDSGVDIDEAAKDLGAEGWTEERERAARKLERCDRLVRERGRIRIPKHAWLWTDAIARDLI